MGLCFEAADLRPAGWLSLVWILLISRAVAAEFRLASILGAVEASEWAAAMWPRRRMDTLLLKDGPGGAVGT